MLGWGLMFQLVLGTSVWVGKSQGGDGGGGVEVYACLAKKTGLIRVSSTYCKGAIASATFSNSINQTGWAKLEVETSGAAADEMQAYAGGLLEGNTTGNLIYWHWLNTVAGYCDSIHPYCLRLQSFLSKNLLWMQQQMDANPNDPYWHQVKLILIQVTGVKDGYYGLTGKPRIDFDSLGFLMFQLGGDLEDLEQALGKPSYAIRKTLGSGSCTAFIKILSGNRDILFAHDTWSTYQSMLRILKVYNFAYHLTPTSKSIIPGQKMSFSSYPGTVLSIDDFYTISSGLAVTETTIGNSNKALYQYIKPVGSVLTWIRGQVANRLATSAKQWTDIFSKRNSGTYNNQWMVVDYKQFSPGKPIPSKGIFYVLEQIPGFTHAEDMTGLLMKQGYWPSYNIPYFKDVYNKSGWRENVHKYGDWFTYHKSPRALILKRDWHSVSDMTSLQKLMRYNNFKDDPLSRCNCTPPYSAENAIAARCDLNPSNGTYPFGSLGHRSHGATDMKATNWKLFQKLQFVAISGPTYDPLPPFQWSLSDYYNNTPHFAHPDKWEFQPILTKWKKI